MLLAGPIIGQVVTAAPASEKADNQLFTVVVSDMQAFRNWALQEQIQVAGSYRPANIVVLRATTQVFDKKIARHPKVLYAVRSTATPKMELPVPGQNLFVNKINAAQAFYPHWNGAGIAVSVREFRFDTSDVDLKGRVVASPNATAEQTSHAAVMASLVAGAGNSDLAGRGAAPGCQLESIGFGFLLPEEDYAERGITVQNHSYGIDIENFYGPNALAYDLCALDNPNLLHVFSAGNSGALTPTDGTYANLTGFANLTGNFKMAKNVLTVGAVDSLGALAFFSSRGPAYDGRVKPDLVAFGQDGTSGAAALVSGAAAVLQQAHQALYGALPGSDLLRAILLHTADEMGAPGPDFNAGYGNLNLKNALQTLEEQRFFTASTFPGAAASYALNVKANTRQVKVTLAWNDLSAQAGAAKALVQDLDLLLVDPGGEVWRPWVLSTAPNPDSLRLPATRARDTLNNVEQITLDLPTPGMYEIQIKAATQNLAGQSFAVVYTLDTLRRFNWIYPLRHDPAVAGKEVLLSWETNLPDTLALLEWKPVGTADWRMVDTAAVVQAGLRRWHLPDTFIEAQVRMRVGAQVFTSDTFLIARELRMNVGFNCPDSVALFWNRVAPVAEYLLYGLGAHYLEPLFSTRDTFLVLQKSQFPQQRFAVAARTDTRAGLSRRSAAPDIGEQGVGCYQKTFIAEKNTNQNVDISLLLGTLYGVKNVAFEKWEGTGFVPVKIFESLENELFVYEDTEPVQGANTYRAAIAASNGGVVYSDTSTVYFAGEKGWLVFPNPVASGGILHILSDGAAAAECTIYDGMGRRLLTRELTGDLEVIPLPNWPAGIYLMEIREDSKPTRFLNLRGF